jgi:DNA oxidative demethylase
MALLGKLQLVMQAPLISAQDLLPVLPEGFRYEPDFLSEAEEQELLDQIQNQTFEDVEMHGVKAKRRVVHLGQRYAYQSRKLTEGGEMPEWLQPLIRRAAARFDIEPDAIAEGLLTEYPPGAGIGWHRDAPAFDKVIGVSLLSPARFRLRPYPDGKTLTGTRPIEVAVSPRSIYLISGPARWRWQHHIPAGKELRYSITLRTLRQH